MVEEHCSNLRRYTVRSAGGPTRAYADTSSENAGEKPARRKTKVSSSMIVRGGLVGPKGMAKAAPDGHTVNIP